MPINDNKNKNSSSENQVPISYEVTAKGSLGLLALGAIGIKAWRKKREEEKQDTEKGKEK